MKNRQPWFVMAALRGIGRHVKTTTQPFGASEVASWDAAFSDTKPEARGLALVRIALEKLEFHELVARHVPQRDTILRPLVTLPPQWLLTPRGLATCRSVLREQPRSKKAPNPNALSTRLWALLRLRKMLTAEEGAATLIDAGTRDFAAAQHQIAGYLRVWAQLLPKVIQVSAKPVNGSKRYVMVKEGGETPPPTKAPVASSVPAPRPLVKRNRTGVNA
jgi:hypothetical protein